MKCSKCSSEATIKQGNQWLCDKHYRFAQMRASAKRNGKLCPPVVILESLKGADLTCPDCGVSMNWRAKDGQCTVATLQHYRNGALAIVCLTCNTRHAFMESDEYQRMDKDHKQCPSCKQIKPLTNFTLDAGRSGMAKRKSICSSCSNVKVQKWKEANREKYNEYQRAYREKRKANGNPVKSGT